MQKYKRGDVVHIDSDLGQSMSHFTNDIDVIVLGSYADQFGGGNTKDYTVLFMEDGNKCSWYHEQQLTFLRHGGEEIIAKIRKERSEREAIESDLGWIVKNWKTLRDGEISGATMEKLMSLLGITNPWGNRGEGVDWHNHARYTIKCLDSVLLTGDIEKVEQYVADFPKVNEFIFSSDVYNGNNELRKPVYVP